MPAEDWTLSAAGYWQADGATSFSPRDTLVYGNYRPTALTAGVVSVASLSTHTGNFVTSQADQIVEGLDITGRVKIRHDNVTFRNCRIQGGLPDGESSYGSVEAFNARAMTTKFYDCTIIANPPTNPAIASKQSRNSSNSIQGRDFEIYRCDLSGSVDGIGAQYSNVTIKGCRIHDLAWYPDSHYGDTASHSDGIQIHGGNGFTIVGNSIEVGEDGSTQYHNSCIIATQDVAATSNVLIDRNWIISDSPSGCAVGINISQTGTYGPGPFTGTVTITNNRFSELSTWRSNHAALIDRGTYDIATISGNVYDATGLPAKVTRN